MKDGRVATRLALAVCHVEESICGGRLDDTVLVA